MDNNKGAMPKGQSHFKRSSKTPRTPPQVTNPNDESTYPCAICWLTDDKPIVSCDRCHAWYHFTCANAPNDVADHEWMCPLCERLEQRINPEETVVSSAVEQARIPPVSTTISTAEIVNEQVIKPNLGNSVGCDPTTLQISNPPTMDLIGINPPIIQQSVPINSNQSRKSRSGTSSSFQRRALALKKLEEERQMELEERERRVQSNKEYLNKKYSILEQGSSDEELSYDDEELNTLKFESIKQWTENIPQVSSTRTKTRFHNQEVQIEDNRDSDPSELNEDELAKVFRKAFPFRGTSDVPITSQSSYFGQQKDTSSHQNAPVSIEVNNERTQQNVRTEAMQYQQVAPELYSNQPNVNPWQNSNQDEFNYQTLTSNNTSQANIGGQATIQGVLNQHPGRPPVARAQVKTIPIYRTEAFVPQQQLHQGYGTRTTVYQGKIQDSVANQTFVGSHNQPHQSYVPRSQPVIDRNSKPVNNGQQFTGSNQTFEIKNRPPVTVNHQRISSQPMNFHQTPVMSTSVYQGNMEYQQPVAFNYHQPILSTETRNQPSMNDQVYDQPVIMRTSTNSQPHYRDSNYAPNHYSHIGGLARANDSHQQDGMMTMQNIMSRQVIDKKLPIFTGNPEEWNSWYNRYLSTTEKCNLDNSENLDRLSKCIKGTAQLMIKCKLGQTEAVPWIISTLQKLYGRPEVILKAVMKRIRNIPPLKDDNLKSIMEFAFEVQSVSTTIESSGIQNQYTNPMLLEDLVDKLPAQTKLSWARYKRANANVTIKTFVEWLDELADDISSVIEPTFDKHENKKNEKRSEKGEKETAYINIHMDSSNNREPSNLKGSKKSSCCLTCGKGCRNVENCSTFSELPIDRKWKKIKELKLCWLCLKKHKFPCNLTNVCGENGCSRKHHQLLHNSDRQSPKISQPNENSTSAGHNAHYEVNQQVLLKYVPVVLHYGEKKVQTIAFFDDGSQASMVEQHLADELGVSGTKEQLCLLWTDNIHRKESAQRISIEISENDSDRRYSLDGIRAVQSLHLPPQTFKRENFIKQFPHLIKTSVRDYENAIPGILIASDFPKLGVQLKSIEGKGFKSPVASKTRLGWTVYGPSGGSADNQQNHVHRVVQVCTHHNQLDNQLHQQIKEFFSIENFGVRANSKTEMESKENLRALDMLEKLTKRVDGRYETGLLWKNDDINKSLPNSYPMAMKRLISLEKQGENVLKVIGDKIEEYVAKGYARKLSDKEVQDLGENVWYLPVFGVVHPKKPEKLRMVFDGAAKVKSVSLNSTLLTGPDELASMVDILRRLREKLIAVGGDVKEMYHQVKIRKEDQKYQLFLFRNGETDRKPDVYAMCVMTFGARCSPAAAQFVKNTNAKTFEKTHPRAVDAIINNHYVDDMMDGENTVDETIQMAQDVKMIHATAGFEIRNFISNSLEVLKALGVSDTCDGKEISLDPDMKTERVLGMWWNTRRDAFTFSLKYTLIAKEILEGKKMPTKRELLRTLMSIFDPLGLLSNYLVQLKILLQDVWRMDLDWDKQISCKSLIDKWKQWLEFLPAVESVQIPRLYSLKLTTDKKNSIEIHTFVDASIDAFSAVTYLRIEDEEGVDCALMGSKARVAPLKYLSIPRKELQSGVLGTRLMTSIIQAQRFKIDRRVIWSDSETVLSWLKSDHRKYSQFVAHRVGEILESTDVTEWRWIPTKENVADEATKWSKNMNFKQSNRWFSGPNFLRLNEDEWPKKKNIEFDTEEEMKAHCIHASLVLPQLVNSENFSNWNRMVRAVAYSIRFRKLFIDRKCKGTPLSQEEITRAENLIIRQAQFEGYPSEMVILIRNRSLPLNKQKLIEKPSPLYDGTPYLDSDGILRMRTRMDGARDLSLNSKRPIVLPRNSRITRLLVHHHHGKYYHQNHSTVINEIRQIFYIPRIRVVLNKVRNACQWCKVKRAKPMNPQMANLPPARLATFTKPFSYVGIDYFGPMKVKVGRRIEKRWGVMFTCLTIRAVHIELVPSLDTNSCILCIENFIADRGEVIEFHSDCGTSFIGANNELKKELDKINPELFTELENEVKKIDPETLKTKFTSRYTNWVFNPPAAAHMGGSWERLIRSVKTGMYSILPTRTPTEETLRNVLKGIQNVINSRPLTYIPLEVEEDEALTPNHFLYGSSNGMKPPCELNVNGEYLRKSWKEAQRVTELFWNRFIKEYLPTIARRTKWHKPINPLLPNDLVLVVDEKNPRNAYPKARVLETKIGSNGQVRRARIELIAKVKTDHAENITEITKTDLWRPAHKLAFLDVLSKPESNSANLEEDRTAKRSREFGAIRNQDFRLAIQDREANETMGKSDLEPRFVGTGWTPDCETGGSVTNTNDNTEIRRSARISKISGNTENDLRQANSRKKK